MASHLIDADGAREIEPQAALFGELAARRRDFFWLDLHGATKEQIRDLGEAFDFHPLSIEDAMSFGQRPKLEEYDHYVFLVVFGAVHDEDNLVEVHCFYSTDFLVTVRRDSAPRSPTRASEPHAVRSETSTRRARSTA